MATIKGEKVARLGIRREAGCIYSIRGNEVWRISKALPGQAPSAPERIAEGGFVREPGWIYFLDADGDVARTQPAPASEDVHRAEPALVGPIEKVVRLGLRREPGYLYYLDGAKLWRTRFKVASEPAPPDAAAEFVVDGGFVCEPGWHYFVDGNGDVSRVRQRDEA